MRIVVRDKRIGPSKRRYTMDFKVDYPKISKSLSLTNKVLNQYRKTKSPVGYATFRGLSNTDIRSILSAVKRLEAHLNVDRWGNVAYYKLNTKR